MTQTQNVPVRWCPTPDCGAPSTLSEEVWQEIEDNDDGVLRPCCCRIPRLYLKAMPK